MTECFYDCCTYWNIIDNTRNMILNHVSGKVAFVLGLVFVILIIMFVAVSILTIGASVTRDDIILGTSYVNSDFTYKFT